MSGHTTHQPHGTGIRGLHNAKNADSNEGKFGRLFKIKPAEFGDADLFTLATALEGPATDLPKDAPDDEESHIPAAFTYFGQFVDHDITFDPETFAQQKSDPDGIVDFRTPRFDLDNVYGRGPGDQPFLYDGIKLLQGEKFLIVVRNPNARDLPRSTASSAGIKHAIIGDPRNDENVIVSQFQGMMFRFHNRVVDLNPGKSFDLVQQMVRWHYQWIVLHDWLPQIVRHDVLDEISPALADPTKSFADHPAHLKFYKFEQPRMPVEFSVAAYRLGHSMVRPGYRVNEFTDPLAIFNQTNPTSGLNAFGEFPKSWTIDWQRFIDLGMGPKPESDQDRVQLAYKIDTSLVNPLAHLPHSVAGDEATADPHLFSLAFRNLRRGVILGLPSGQDVAKAMGLTPLPDSDIRIGSATGNVGDAPSIATIAGGVFNGKCPLWAYILAEGRKNFFDHGKAQLGPVGGRIVAEVFLGLLTKDGRSFLSAQPDWKPTLGQGGNFTLADLLKVALQG